MERVATLKLGLILAVLGLVLLPVLHAQDSEDENIIREYDEILVKGAPERMFGTIVRETETEYYFRLRDLPDMVTRIPKDTIEDLKRRTTPVQAFRAKRASLKLDDYKACYELAQWSLQFPELRARTKQALCDCIKMKPDFLDAYLLLSDLIREEYQNPAGATEEQLNLEIELYRHAIGSGLTDPRIYYRLGLAVRKAGLPGAALKLFESAIEHNKTASIPEITVWSHQESGEILVELVKPDEALKRFEQVLAARPDDFRSLLGKGEAKLLLGELDEAAPLLVQAVGMDANFSRAYTLLGSIAYLKGELSDAEVWLDRARAVGLPDAANLTALGLVHARMGKFISAAAEMSEALATDPGYWQAHFARGYLAENEGQFNEAIAAYQSALQLNPGSGLAHYKLAYCYYRDGDKDATTAGLNEALKTNMRPAEVLKFLGRIEFEDRKWAAAARYFRHAVVADQKDPDAHYMLAMARLKLEQNSLAHKAFLKALEHDPSHIGALNGLGYLAYRSGSFREAARCFNDVITIDRGNPYAGEGLKNILQVLKWDRWEDDFKRPDSDDVSNGWNEENDARYGIEIRIDSNTARFSGKQREAGKTIFLSRIEGGKTFRRIEARINGLQAHAARWGLRIERRSGKGDKEKMEGALVLIKDLDGFLSYNYTQEKSKWKDPKNALQIEQFPVETKAHKFAITVVNAKTGTFELMFDDRKLVQVTCPPLANVRELVMGIYGEADADVPWTLLVENVRVFKYKQQAKKSGSGF